MKLLTTLLVLILIPVSISWGGENVFFFGGRYDDGFMLSYGTAIDIGPNLWALEYANWGAPYGEVSSEVAYIMPIVGHFSFGVLCGPNCDWHNTDCDPVTYVTGAGGMLATYDFGARGAFRNVGCWGYGKYKFDFKTDTDYLDGWAVGGGVYVWW